MFKGEPVDPRSKYQSFHPADQRAARREAHALLEEAKHAVEVASAAASAYGAAVTTERASIGLDEPYPFRFAGIVTRL